MINWERVNDLENEVGSEAMEEVIALFLEETDDVVTRLQKNSYQQLALDLHFLKGSALNLGFDDLAQLCQDGERSCNGGSGEEIDLSVIAALYHASKQEFLGRFPRLRVA